MKVASDQSSYPAIGFEQITRKEDCPGGHGPLLFRSKPGIVGHAHGCGYIQPGDGPLLDTAALLELQTVG